MEYSKHYAVESIEDSDMPRRHIVGTLEECRSFSEKLMDDCISNHPFDTPFVRVVEITDDDREFWENTLDVLPDMDNRFRVYGEWVNIKKAAEFLGLTFGRVFQLIDQGILESKKDGKYHMVSTRSLLDRKLNGSKRGRPAGSKNKKADNVEE